ncbi:methyltransferase [Neptuniibacter pectenicola]|jgi:16S rRNA (guanine1207-N2)-methyltransferase|uniref:Methyltransferase n=1 Tax=Neptuniibacter pectenicola TaxID=1806669 RepID=A0ABU9TWU1_9GAMM|nr:methyltransferase [Neptuniibacter pectenicola]
MSDSAFPLLAPYIKSATTKSLWLADENFLDANLPPNDAVICITNRIDLHEHLQKQGWKAFFSDYDLSIIEDNSLERVIYRVSKEKLVAHHLINEAYRCLKVGGELILAGGKNEGIKTYFTKAKALFGMGENSKNAKDTWLAKLIKTNQHSDDALDDKDYHQLRTGCIDDRFEYQSKPGIFGWDKVDKGSAYLIEHLDSFLMTLPEPPKNALDLGCGYGYLSLNLTHLDIPVTATDNNAAAIIACERNFARYPINAKVIAANCAQGIKDKFDLIVCNPPFHAGFSIDGDLTDRFLKAAHDHLNEQGIACFVTNMHIPLERKALKYFHQAECIMSNGNFKLIRLTHKM